MRKPSLLIAMSMSIAMLSTAAFSQAGTAVRTCSEAYSVCFDGCSQRFPGGDDASAKCIDNCAMTRAKCDRNGCFTNKVMNVCGLAKQ